MLKPANHELYCFHNLSQYSESDFFSSIINDSTAHIKTHKFTSLLIY